jgi:hypothetical protein
MNAHRNSCLVSVLMLSSIQSLLATPITINGRNINEILTPEQVLQYENLTATNVAVSLKDGALEIGDMVLDNLEAITTYRNELENNKHTLTQHAGGTRLASKSASALSFYGAYVTGDEQVVLDAGANLEIYNAIVQSKEVIFACNTLKVRACFVDAPILQLESSSPESLIKIIRFTFNTEQSAHACIQGILDFARNQTEEPFIALGACKAEIAFAPHAFE